MVWEGDDEVTPLSREVWHLDDGQWICWRCGRASGHRSGVHAQGGFNKARISMRICTWPRFGGSVIFRANTTAAWSSAVLYTTVFASQIGKLVAA